MCMGCLIDLSDFSKTKFLDVDSKPYCSRCFDKLSFKVKRSLKKYYEKEKNYGVYVEKTDLFE